MGRLKLFGLHASCSEAGGQSVVELFHGDLAVTILVESTQKSVVLVSSGVDTDGMETVRELGQADEAVVVLVEGLHEEHGVLLQGTVRLGSILDLLKDDTDAGLGEDIRVVFHILLRVLVS